MEKKWKGIEKENDYDEKLILYLNGKKYSK